MTFSCYAGLCKPRSMSAITIIVLRYSVILRKYVVRIGMVVGLNIRAIVTFSHRNMRDNPYQANKRPNAWHRSIYFGRMVVKIESYCVRTNAD